jgi:acyl-CoA dehydrogenase
MSDMREVLESAVERLFGDAVTPSLLHEAERGQWPALLWSEVEGAGLTHAVNDEAAGGAGATWSEIFALVRAIGRHGAPIPLVETLIGNWALGAAGLSTLGGPIAIATAPEDQLHMVLSGVAWGGACEHLVILATGARPRLLLFARPDFTIQAAANIAGEPRDDVALGGAVPKAAADWTLAPEAILMAGAMARSAQIAGAIERVLDQSTQYAGERVQFGRPIGQFQAVQQMLAQLATQSLLASAAAEYAFNTADEGFSDFAIASAKTCTSELAGLAASAAHAVHGALGITHEHSLHFATRRLWSWRSEFGGHSFWADRLGRYACSAGSTRLWPAVTQGAFTSSGTA